MRNIKRFNEGLFKTPKIDEKEIDRIYKLLYNNEEYSNLSVDSKRIDKGTDKYQTTFKLYYDNKEFSIILLLRKDINRYRLKLLDVSLPGYYINLNIRIDGQWYIDKDFNNAKEIDIENIHTLISDANRTFNRKVEYNIKKENSKKELNDKIKEKDIFDLIIGISDIIGSPSIKLTDSNYIVVFPKFKFLDTIKINIGYGTDKEFKKCSNEYYMVINELEELKYRLDVGFGMEHLYKLEKESDQKYRLYLVIRKKE